MADDKEPTVQEQLDAIKEDLELVKNLLNHTVLVLRENNIQSKVDIPTIEEALANEVEEGLANKTKQD